MRRTFYDFFRISGIPVVIHWSVCFWPLLGMFDFPRGLFLALSIPVIFVIHELGHLAAARALGFRPFRILIYSHFAIFQCYPVKQRRGKELVLMSAGILAQAILFLLTFTASQYLHRYFFQLPQTLDDYISILLGVNFALMVLNLIPYKNNDGAKIRELLFR